MKFYCYNAEPNGRLYITDGMGGTRVRMEPSAIDAFVEALQAHVSSEGDGRCFSIDDQTGEVEIINSSLA